MDSKSNGIVLRYISNQKFHAKFRDSNNILSIIGEIGIILYADDDWCGFGKRVK
jgi:hypothetical protein